MKGVNGAKTTALQFPHGHSPELLGKSTIRPVVSCFALRRLRPRLRVIPSGNFSAFNKIRIRNCMNSYGESSALKVSGSNMGTTELSLYEDMIFEAILENGIFRFDCSVDARASAFPSLSFTDPTTREIPLKSGNKPNYMPRFEIKGEEQIVIMKLPDGSNFYGTGEVSGPLERTGRRIFTWNSDAWGYGSGTTSLYQSHPWVLVILPDGNALGVLADTTRRCEIDLREACKIRFVASASYPVITFGPYESPTEVLIHLSHAIGTVFMPPKWSLGYHQCRWGYDTDKRVLEIAQTFRDKSIPCDVVWMDIGYMDGYKCFTFHEERFSNPKSLFRDLHALGFHAIWMLDPGIKRQPGYFVYDSGSENDVWVLKENLESYVGDVWPGPCVFPDYTRKETRTWWAKLVKDFMSNGVNGIWNDMNEPAVFRVLTKTMPEGNIHRGDPELGGCQNHSHYHNVYGMLMARSTYEGMKMHSGERRPFVLTRAGFIGSQRVSVVSRYLGQILVALQGMLRLNYLEGGWELAQCFLFLVVIQKLKQLTMNHGPSVPSYILQSFLSCYLNFLSFRSIRHKNYQ